MTYTATIEIAGPLRTVRDTLAPVLLTLLESGRTDTADDVMDLKSWFGRPEDGYEGIIRTGDGSIAIKITREGE